MIASSWHDTEPFQLDEGFIAQRAGRQPEWGPVGYVTYKRTYARSLESVPTRIAQLAKIYGVEGSEEFWLTCVRVVEGEFRIQQQHCLKLGLPWSNAKAQQEAQESFTRMWQFKWLPPGRGLWMMGTDYVDRAGGAALNNCAFVSTAQINISFSAPFTFLMDMSMLGVGVGGDCEGAGLVRIQKPRVSGKHVVSDDREGWVALVRRTLDAFVGLDTLPSEIDYTPVRPAGQLIKGFGGTAAGPGPLKELQEAIVAILMPLVGKDITSTAIVDIFNVVGRCVVAGNIRRSAEIMFGRPADAEFMKLKDPTDVSALEAQYQRLVDTHEANDVKALVMDKIVAHPLKAWRWASNNSQFAEVGMDYHTPAYLTSKNGEPGYLWLANARAYGRMIDPPNHRDHRAAGGNPCLEQTLESFELCCLVETFPSRHDSYEDYERTLKQAYRYAKTVTLVPTHDARTNAVLLRNRRIGTSMSGIVQAMNKVGRRTFLSSWCDQGYKYLQKLDTIYSDWLCVPRSIKSTSVKPSGTVSLLPGVTPGIHYPHDEYYFRVIRFDTASPLVTKLRAAGYRCETIDPRKEPNTTAVYFAVKEPFFERGKRDVSMWEQLELAAQLQAYWADNQVSCTVTFKPGEANDIKHALELYETRLKGISFLPFVDEAEEYAKLGFEHVPYQAIDEAVYTTYVTNLKPVDLAAVQNEVLDKGCDGDTCQAPLAIKSA